MIGRNRMRGRWAARTARGSAWLALAAGACGAACERPGRTALDRAPLEEAVDSLLPALERLSGLRTLRPVRVARQSPGEVRDYVLRRLDEYLPRAELEGVRETYVLLGLLPDTLDLRTLLIELYSEQIAGYYDPVTKTLHAVEGAPVASVLPVLAHELVHALQDQHVDLDSLIARRRGNDRQAAAQAAIEGHATLVMFAWLAERASGTAADPAMLPDPAAQLRPAFEQADAFPVFARAPRIIRETLIFPYVAGATFVRELWRHQPPTERTGPFGAWLPQSTEQVLHPLERFIGVRDDPTELRYAADPAGVTAFENSLGALETGIFLEAQLGPLESPARGWDGDRLRLLRLADGSRVLLWSSIWDDPASADLFAQRAVQSLARLAPLRHGRVERAELEDRPIVHIVIADTGVSADAVSVPRLHCADEAARPLPCPAD